MYDKIIGEGSDQPARLLARSLDWRWCNDPDTFVAFVGAEKEIQSMGITSWTANGRVNADIDHLNFDQLMSLDLDLLHEDDLTRVWNRLEQLQLEHEEFPHPEEESFGPEMETESDEEDAVAAEEVTVVVDCMPDNGGEALTQWSQDTLDEFEKGNRNETDCGEVV